MERTVSDDASVFLVLYSATKEQLGKNFAAREKVELNIFTD